MDKSYRRLIKYEPWLHAIFWMATLFLQAVKFVETGYTMGAAHCFVELGFNLIPAYTLYFFILPKVPKNKIAWSIIVMLTLNLIAFLYADNFFHLKPIYKEWTVVLTILIRHISICLFFFALYSIKKLYKQQKEIETISTKEQQAQLRLLKGQINPHFLFNTLNTIYASALEKDGKTADLILKLSDSFRYILHEGQKNKVLLSSEMRLLKDYINLQKERLADKVMVHWEEEIDDYDKEIPPLLLISFIENAFKYSSTLVGTSHLIHIKLVLDNDDFTFYCENSFRDLTNEEMDVTWKESGIGIQNTKKRLELLFPNSHELKINAENFRFTVDLKIKL